MVRENLSNLYICSENQTYVTKIKAKCKSPQPPNYDPMIRGRIMIGAPNWGLRLPIAEGA